MTYPIIHVPDQAAELPEALGTKPKFWYSDGDRLVLYKEGRPGSGEHWAEKICCELCHLLGIPHANYELATWKGHKGVVSEMFVPEGARMVFGNELLARMVTDYQQHAKRYKAREHTVRRVMLIVGAAHLVSYPAGFNPPGCFRNAADVFVGYLMLDALVANQDRHHENWGLILDKNQIVTLSPTFDHASSLGRNERDENRRRRLNTRDRGDSVEHYASRAESAFYPLGGAKPLKTLEAYAEAARISPLAAQYWISRLGDISMNDIETIVGQIPTSEMSDPARQFAVRLMQINRDRLLALLQVETCKSFS